MGATATAAAPNLNAPVQDWRGRRRPSIAPSSKLHCLSPGDSPVQSSGRNGSHAVMSASRRRVGWPVSDTGNRPGRPRRADSVEEVSGKRTIALAGQSGRYALESGHCLASPKRMSGQPAVGRIATECLPRRIDRYPTGPGCAAEFASKVRPTVSASIRPGPCWISLGSLRPAIR